MLCQDLSESLHLMLIDRLVGWALRSLDLFRNWKAEPTVTGGKGATDKH